MTVRLVCSIVLYICVTFLIPRFQIALVLQLITYGHNLNL